MFLANKIAPVRLFIKFHPTKQAEQAEMYVKAFQNDEHTQVLSSQDAPCNLCFT